jgi:uncharacterized membrane protein
VLAIPFVVLFVGGEVAVIATTAAQSKNETFDPTALIIFFVVAGILVLGMSLLSILFGVLFFFVYPLIVDRGLSGIEAIKLSARAGLANFRGLVGVILLMILLGIVGNMACYVGLVFMYPVLYSMMAVAYRQVFPAEGSVLLLEQQRPTNWPPQEAGQRFTPSEADQTGVQLPTVIPVTTAEPPPPSEPVHE